jgi:hypothetical protein
LLSNKKKLFIGVGCHVGTLGQEEFWDLNDPESFAPFPPDVIQALDTAGNPKVKSNRETEARHRRMKEFVIKRMKCMRPILPLYSLK